MTTLLGICRDAWADSMLTIRISSALSRVEEDKEQEEDDKALIEKGIEMVSQIRRYFQFMEFGGTSSFDEHEIGYAFFDLMRRRGIRLERHREFLDLYEKSLSDSLAGYANENVGETGEFFQDFSEYLSCKITGGRSRF